MGAVGAMLAFGYLLGFMVPSLGDVYTTMNMPIPSATSFFVRLSHFPLPVLPVVLLLGLFSYVSIRASQQRGTVRLVALLIAGLAILLIFIALLQPLLSLRRLLGELT